MKRWQWSAPSQACFQRFALDQLHRVKALAIILPRPVIKNGGDVRVPKPRGGACFAQKAFPGFGVGRNASVDDLEGYFIPQDSVKGLKGDAHRAPTQLDRPSIGVDSDLVMVKALRICSRNFRLVPCQIE